ncbi:MAG: apolipoprotein N-acyltransferase [Alphaproteobacteria bacterium]
MSNSLKWHACFFSILCGALLALALPPFKFFPLIFICFPLLLLLLDKAHTKKQAFLIGWFFGTGFFIAGMYWIANALLVPPAQFKWAYPLAAIALPAFLAIFIGAATSILHLLKAHKRQKVIAFALLWSLMEYARGNVLTGLPWNLIGYSTPLEILQVTAIFGIYGLSFLTVLAGSSLYVFKKNKLFILLMILPLLASYGWGQQRLDSWPTKAVHNVLLRLVQPNIPQQDKWRIDLKESNFQKLLTLSHYDEDSDNLPTHIIWPEAAAPYKLDENLSRRMQAASILDKNQILLTGSITKTKEGDYANSFLAIDNHGRIAASYNKSHLVPFGEYIPYQNYIPFLKPLAAKMGEMIQGDGPTTLSIPNTPPLSPLICYEVIFPGEVIGVAKKRAEWMLNVTNDAWYGISTGPYQHLEISRTRAIEEGVPLVRVAGTGISAIFDAYGRTIETLPLGKQGILDAHLPRPALKKTLFATFGNIPFLSFLTGSLFLILVLSIFRRKK